MELSFLSSSLHSTHGFDYSGISKHNDYTGTADLRAICSESMGINGLTKIATNGNSKRRQKRQLISRSKDKKTHLSQFSIRQRKSKRPKPVPKMFLSGANLVRFGTFCGIRDSRATRCSLRGVSHGIFIRSGMRCVCTSFALYPSPLVCLVASMRNKAVGTMSNL